MGDQGNGIAAVIDPQRDLAGHLNEIPRDRPIVICCRSGYRSSTAASLLQRSGIHQISDLEDGMNAWQTMTA